MLTRARAPERLTLPVETPEKALENLLRELLSVEQLRRLLRGLPGGEALVDELPGAPASSAEVLHQAVLELKRAGMVDQELFDALAEERPRKAARIQAVAEVWATATLSVDQEVGLVGLGVVGGARYCTQVWPDDGIANISALLDEALPEN